jgi:chemotaxis methyl-accepting protein methylase
MVDKITPTTLFHAGAGALHLLSQPFPRIEKTVADRDLRVWCAAGSPGGIYTLAMLIDEFLDFDLGAVGQGCWRVPFRKVLTDASLGIYSQEGSIRSGAVEAEVFRRCRSAGIRSRLPSKRRSSTGGSPDRTSVSVRKKFHVIFCRNVMIYSTADRNAISTNSMTSRAGVDTCSSGTRRALERTSQSTGSAAGGLPEGVVRARLQARAIMQQTRNQGSDRG